jgi:hypothetical protein
MKGIFRNFSILVAAALMLLLVQCGTSNNGSPDYSTEPDTPTETDGLPTTCTPGTLHCEGNVSMVCAADGRSYENQVDCSATSQVCAPGLGCVNCFPGQSTCEGNTPMRCPSDGSGWQAQDPCPAGTVCRAGSCIDLCAEAESKNSYIGCNYWAVATANSELAEDFEYALAIANPQDMDALVDITNGGGVTTNATVPPHSLQTVVLPYFPDLKMDYGTEASALDPNGAYSLRSSVPVTVYQFNPLEYRLDHDCANAAEDPTPLDGQCFSYSNDASLLLPEHVLTGNYYVMARPTMTIQRAAQFSQSPGYVAIAAVKPGTTNVDITFTCRTFASTDGTIRAFSRGETGNFSLSQYNVLQIVSDMPSTCINGVSESGYTYCDNGYEYDFSGTRVTADQAVAVFSGHNCTFVPFNRWACDHLEEQMFPLETWGKEYVVSRSIPMFTDNPEPNVWKLLSGRDGNVITFDPPSVNPEITLNAGQWVEFESWDNFQVSGTEGFMITQFMVGMNYYGVLAAASESGDPAMCLGVPFEQYRSEYTFLTPTTYERSYVNVTIAGGHEGSIMLDGGAVAVTWSPVGSSGFVTATIELVGGAHTITADDVFGIIVYGVGDYTSYMYPGGLDLEQIFVI